MFSLHLRDSSHGPSFRIVSVQFSSVAQSCPTLCNPMDCSTPGLPVHHQLPEFIQTHAHWVSDAIQPSHPLLSPSLPVFNLSQHQGLFKWISSSHHWPKYWSLSFIISPSNEHSGLMSFGMGWLNLLAVQGTLKSLMQHHSSKASILWCSAFFMGIDTYIFCLSLPYRFTSLSVCMYLCSKKYLKPNTGSHVFKYLQMALL